jgi:hypothetical protein
MRDEMTPVAKVFHDYFHIRSEVRPQWSGVRSETVPPDKQAVVGAGKTVLVRPGGDAEASGSVHKDHTGLGTAALHKGV